MEEVGEVIERRIKKKRQGPKQKQEGNLPDVVPEICLLLIKGTCQPPSYSSRLVDDSDEFEGEQGHSDGENGQQDAPHGIHGRLNTHADLVVHHLVVSIHSKEDGATKDRQGEDITRPGGFGD